MNVLPFRSAVALRLRGDAGGSPRSRHLSSHRVEDSHARRTLSGRGWQCARFSKFPQELVLRLDHPARIHQIQLLSHEYKIATKIELYTGLLPPGESSLDRAIMRRLGHLSFDPNTASGHQVSVRR